ncbi:hypothetical protein EHQ12_04080 [Leptospira gomenensis]|uniref:Uncharacterized protein n=1 Tax=Leptospira gomenensis TaxID=2484974 RepID=A0A5F1YJ15_9LEPT|nr:hypothetical protein EHQ17_04640 [Leptospira gomenensis]TGK42756.1 hypothetical protein EHQ07_13860 [Leptospira gomenensis]TGK42944.1 hypothetical protein EHQ12_04080 [Leptospira gomenensis]TGK54955.1 hypothetical protein EHQ13_18335 [Leptospira gomenensis]
MSIVRKNLNLGRSTGKSLVVGMARAFDLFGVIDAEGLREIYAKTDSEILREDMEIVGRNFRRVVIRHARALPSGSKNE